jgi:exodeoxyribonuclease III
MNYFPADAFRDAGYHVSFCGMKAYNGVALVSRRKPDAVRFGFEDDGPADAPRLLHARFGELHVINTYVPQGRDIEHAMFGYKQQWYQRLDAYVRRHLQVQHHALWMGDLNVAAEPIDVYNPERRAGHVCYHEAVRKAFAGNQKPGAGTMYTGSITPSRAATAFFDYRTDFSAAHIPRAGGSITSWPPPRSPNVHATRGSISTPAAVSARPTTPRWCADFDVIHLGIRRGSESAAAELIPLILR